jgi:hypothetical protein
MFAALNTVEPPILERETAEGDKTWYEECLPLVEDRVRDRLDQLSGRLSDADWLDGAFSAGDLHALGGVRCAKPRQIPWRLRADAGLLLIRPNEKSRIGCAAASRSAR